MRNYFFEPLNFELSIFNFQFYLGVPAPLTAPPSGFPLYLCSLHFRLAQKCPLSVVRCLLSEIARKGCRSNP